MEFKSEKTKYWIGIFVAIVVCFFVLFVPTKLLSSVIFLSFENNFYLSRVLLWVGLLGLFIYARRVEKQRFLLWEEKTYSFGFYCLSVISVLILTYIVLLIFAITVYLINGLPKPSDSILKLASIFKNNYPLVIFTCVTAAVVEELIFRGFIQSRLQVIFKNKIIPILFSSILFGVLHIGFGTLINILGPICIGLVFSLFYEKYRNIKVLMVCHFLWDLTILLLQMRVKLN